MSGDTPLAGQKHTLPQPFLDDFRKDIDYIQHTPLIYGGYHLGVLWLGHRQPIDQSGQVLINSISDVIANSLYTSRFERQVPGDGSETVHSLVKKLSLWDSNTFNHSLRMVPWAKATAVSLGCSDQEIQVVCWATLLHDVGKLSVPKSILYKPGSLTKDEWTLVRLHPSIGARMVGSVRKLIATREIIGSHHEKFDGSGYPFGLNHENIPLGARILAVVDAYGAMTEERAYKRAFSHQEAIEEIQACSGSHFDPEVSRAFLEQFKKLPESS
jgi:putative nucleotidyltransferase with HDIG domain